jgi:hypothetical protein
MTGKVGGSHILGVCQSIFDLGLVGNEKYCFWLMGWVPALVPPLLGVLISLYIWNLEAGKLRNLRRPFLRCIELPFLLV